MMTTLTAIAVVVADATGRVIPGVVGKLSTKDETVLLMTIANNDGYDVFANVPVPFVGEIRLSSGVVFYTQPISIPEGARNVTIRVGPTPSNPQDILLPGAVPSFG